MRIGVHSGNLFAGVIGEAKLQFDIWGKKANPLHENPLVAQISQILLGLDVTIANVLESTGVAGFVHISEATLNNLSKQRYVIEDGLINKTSRDDRKETIDEIKTLILWHQLCVYKFCT